MSELVCRSRIELAAHTADLLGESPMWCHREGVLYWVDMRAPALRRLQPRTGEVSSWAMQELCGAVVLGPETTLVLALQSGLVTFDAGSGQLSPLLAPEPASSGNRLNDTKVDRRGRLWSSTMRDYGAAPTGALYRIDADLSCRRLLDGLTIPNALCWSPDERAMYFADTAQGWLRSYAFDADEGRLGVMKTLTLDGVAGRPDGATVDSAGCVWLAMYQGGCVVRITPAGAVDQRIALPVSRVTSCTFGGSDLRTLYITTARQGMTSEESAAQPLAGAVFAVRLDTAGVAEPAFVQAISPALLTPSRKP